LLVLYLSQSRGAWVAIAVAGLFIVALSVLRRVLFAGGLIFFIALIVIIVVLHRVIIAFLFEGHPGLLGVNTLTKRFYLWLSALLMIQERPLFGYGMENWLCYYSYNSICQILASILPFRYWFLRNPVTGAPTDLQNESTLSHPHNILLHVWVSIGVFGLLAFILILGFFFWLFARILIHVRSTKSKGSSHLEWMIVGAAMLATLIHGQVDSSFLAQDLSFCFWMLVTTLLLLRILSGTSWKGKKGPLRD